MGVKVPQMGLEAAPISAGVLLLVLLLLTCASKAAALVLSSRLQTGTGASSSMVTAQLAIAGVTAAVIQVDSADSGRPKQRQHAVALPLLRIKKEKKTFFQLRYCTESLHSFGNCRSWQFQQQPEDMGFQPQQQWEHRKYAARQQEEQHCRLLRQQPRQRPQQRRRQWSQQRLFQTPQRHSWEQKRAGDQCHREASSKKIQHYQHRIQVKYPLANFATFCNRSGSKIGFGPFSDGCLFLAGGGQPDTCRSSFLSRKSEETNARTTADAAVRRRRAPVAALSLWSAYNAACSSVAAIIVAVTRAAATNCRSCNHQLVRITLAAITWWSACSRNKEHLLVLRSSIRARLRVSAPSLRLFIFQSTCLLRGAQMTSQAVLVEGCFQQALRSAAVRQENLAASPAGPAVAVASAVTLTGYFTAAAAGFLLTRLAMPTGAPALVTRLGSAAGMASSRGDPAKSSGAVAACLAGGVGAVHAEGFAASRADPAAASAAGAAGAVGRGCAPVPAAAYSKLSCTRSSLGSSPPEDMEVLSFRKDPVPGLGAAETAATHRTVCATSALPLDAAGLSLKKIAARGNTRHGSGIAITAPAAKSLPPELADERGPEKDPAVHFLARMWEAADRRETSRLEGVHERLKTLSLCSGSPPYDVVPCRQCISGITAEIPAALADGNEAAEVYGVDSWMLRAHHNRKRNKLGRPYGHRRCLLRNLCTQAAVPVAAFSTGHVCELAAAVDIICSLALLKYGSIVTTFAKAKECKRSMDKVLMLCKQPSLHTYRQALGFFYDKRLCRQLFIEAPERFAYRPHGFCRIEKMPFCRLGDNAEMARVELVD